MDARDTVSDPAGAAAADPDASFARIDTNHDG